MSNQEEAQEMVVDYGYDTAKVDYGYGDQVDYGYNKAQPPAAEGDMKGNKKKEKSHRELYGYTSCGSDDSMKPPRDGGNGDDEDCDDDDDDDRRGCGSNPYGYGYGGAPQGVGHPGANNNELLAPGEAERTRSRRRNSCLVRRDDEDPLAVAEFLMGGPPRMSDRDMMEAERIAA